MGAPFRGIQFVMCKPKKQIANFYGVDDIRIENACEFYKNIYESYKRIISQSPKQIWCVAVPYRPDKGKPISVSAKVPAQLNRRHRWNLFQNPVPAGGFFVQQFVPFAWAVKRLIPSAHQNASVGSRAEVEIGSGSLPNQRVAVPYFRFKWFTDQYISGVQARDFLFQVILRFVTTGNHQLFGQNGCP